MDVPSQSLQLFRTEIIDPMFANGLINKLDATPTEMGTHLHALIGKRRLK